MIAYGALSPTDGIPKPADTIATRILAAGTAQAIDVSTAAKLLRVSGMSTGGVAQGFFVNIGTTRAAIPTSGSATGTTAVNHPVHGSRMFQIPGGTTGISVIADIAGRYQAEFWTM